MRPLWILALCLPASAQAGVVINELMPDPAGADKGNEWVELLNTGDAPVALEGWRLERAKGAWTESDRVRHTFAADVVLAPGGRLVIGEALVAGADILVPDRSGTVGGLDLGNAASNADSVRLVNSGGVVVDVVVYGPANADSFPDESGSVVADSALAPKPVQGSALARIPDGRDTNSGADWQVAAATMGEGNPIPPGCEPGASLKLNELLPDPPGTDSEALAEWIELLNTGSAPAALEGWRLQRASNATNWSTVYTFDASASLAAGAFGVVGEANVPDADWLAAGVLGLYAGTGGDGVRLVDCADTVIDTVLYGGENADAMPEDDGEIPASVGPRPGAGQSVARRQDGLDTDRSAADLWVPLLATPGASNPAPFVCPGGGEGVVLNELLPDPVGADAEALGEWVELYHGGSEAVALEGWRLERASNASNWSTFYTFPAASLDPAGFLVVAEANVPGADLYAEALLGLYGGTGGDGVRLLDCDGIVVDTLLYGGENADALAEDDGTVPDQVGPKPGSGESVARRADGVDANRSADDLWVPGEVSPGTANPLPASCAVDVGEVLLNEALVNPAGADGTVLLEYVELHHAGAEPADVGGWRLATASSGAGWTVRATLPADTFIEPGGFLVIGEPMVAEADVLLEGTLGLLSGAGGDGLRLIDCAGSAVDTLVYGADNADEVLDDSEQVATSLAPRPGDDQALARKIDGVDTDVCADDWWLAPERTPGAMNPEAPICVDPPEGVRIDEVYPDPVGADATAMGEWIEIYNPATEPASLAGWSVQVATSGDSWRTVATLGPREEVAAGGRFVIGEANVAGADAVVVALGLPNGTGGDGVRLLDCRGNPIDVLVYGGVNDDGILGLDGQVATEVAPKPGEGRSVARAGEGEFQVVEGGSPGGENPPPPVCEANNGTITLNELLPDPDGADGTVLREYVELYLGGDTGLALDGWRLQVVTRGDGWRDLYAFAEGARIEPGGLFVVGEVNVPEADAVVEGTLGLPSGSGGDAVRLLDCAGEIVDLVVYGGENADAVSDADGLVAETFAPRVRADQALSRRVEGVDTDDHGEDWWVSVGTPGAMNPPPPICEPALGIRLNEAVVNPAGADSVALAEWVELINTSESAVRLDGWHLLTAASADGYGVVATFPDDTWLPAGGFLVVGEPNAPVVDVEVPLLGLLSGAGGDGLRLDDCRGEPVDTLVYGASNDDAVIDDAGVAATSYASQPAEGQALARRVDGYDTDLSGDDWAVTGEPSPGAPNPEATCQGGEGSIVINELLSDPPGADSSAQAEWIELYNRGGSAVDLGGWGFIFANRPSETVFDLVLSAGTVIEPGGFLVIGDRSFADADVTASLSIGNGTGGDAVRLVDCAGVEADAVIYGPDNADGHANEDGLVEDDPAPAPPSGRVLARVEDGVDTNRGVDWAIPRVATPGESNVQPDGPGPGDTGEPRRGCGRRDDVEVGLGSCSTTGGLPLGGLELLGAALALVRRRRR